MTSILSDFGTYLRDHLNEEIDTVVNGVIQHSESYRTLGSDKTYQSVHTSMLLIADAFITGSTETVISRLRNVGADRAEQGFSIEDILLVITYIRSFIWDKFEVFHQHNSGVSIPDARGLEDVLHLLSRTLMLGYGQSFQQTLQAVSQQAAEIEAQRFTIRELGTPILPLYPGVIALPLVGAIDSYRATQVLERLLEEISAKQADIVIIDITGVPVVDTGVANYLLQTARAAQLVGAQVVLVGIGAEIAPTMVQLGVNLNQLKVYA
ncbi:MAG: STAS domain-containing protein, partial [Oscillochloris sp.]|nr:STAS domain-containing protein [Oscillochloris sp.]